MRIPTPSGELEEAIKSGIESAAQRMRKLERLATAIPCKRTSRIASGHSQPGK